MKYLIIVLSFFLTSCTTMYGTGLDHLNAGDNESALRDFNSCASQGDADCYNAIGQMYESGRIQSVAPMEDALRYYTMAARYGNEAAQSNLVRLGYDIPPADLQRRASPEEQRLLMEAAGNLGKAIGGAARQ